MKHNDIPVAIECFGVLFNGNILGINNNNTFFVWNNSYTVEYTGTFDVPDKIFILGNTFVTVKIDPHFIEYLQQWNLRGECIYQYRTSYITCVIELIGKTSSDIVIGLIIILASKKIRLKGHTAHITYLKVIGHKIISSSKDNTLRIWDKGICTCIISTDNDKLFLVNDNVFASRGVSNIIKIWDL